MSRRQELNQTANHLGAFTLLVQDRVRQALQEEMGRGESAPAALLTVGTRPDQTIEALRRTLGLSHSATVRLVEGLIENGLIRKRPGPDRRSASLRLTAQGKQMFARLLDRRRHVLRHFLRNLNPAVYDALREALVTLLEDSAASREQAWHTCRFCEHQICRPCPVGSTVRGERT